MVFPGAVHSRFEHSLGVYCLAGKATDIIKKYQVYPFLNFLI
jgi:HD superfamily phosphohydrolase